MCSPKNPVGTARGLVPSCVTPAISPARNWTCWHDWCSIAPVLFLFNGLLFIRRLPINFHWFPSRRDWQVCDFFFSQRGSAFTFKNLRFVDMLLNIDLLVYLFILIGLLGFKPGRKNVILFFSDCTMVSRAFCFCNFDGKKEQWKN